MTARPADPMPGPDTGPYEVIHLGGQAAVVVPVADFLRLRALELQASAEELQDASALADWKAREAAGQTAYVSHEEVQRRLTRSRTVHRTDGGYASGDTGLCTTSPASWSLSGALRGCPSTGDCPSSTLVLGTATPCATPAGPPAEVEEWRSWPPTSPRPYCR
jgi:hypothetical protein